MSSRNRLENSRTRSRKSSRTMEFSPESAILWAITIPGIFPRSGTELFPEADTAPTDPQSRCFLELVTEPLEDGDPSAGE